MNSNYVRPICHALLLGCIQLALIIGLSIASGRHWDWQIDLLLIVFWWLLTGIFTGLILHLYGQNDIAHGWGRSVFYSGLALTLSPLLGSLGTSDAAGVVFGIVGIIGGFSIAAIVERLLLMKLKRHPAKIAGLRLSAGLSGVIAAGLTLPGAGQEWNLLRLALLPVFFGGVFLISYTIARFNAVIDIYQGKTAPQANLSYAKILIGAVIISISMVVRLLYG